VNRQRVLLIGAGGHARSCIDVIEELDRHQIVGLVGLPAEVGQQVFGYPVLGSDDDLPELLGMCDGALVTVGQLTTPRVRMDLFEAVCRGQRRLAVVQSPRAHVSRHAVVADGTIVMHGAVINAGARVGRNVIVNSQALIEHDTVVGDHCHVSTGARLNSGVRVGEGSFIGSGSVARQLVTIGAICVIGMGQSIRKDCPDGGWVPQVKQA